MSPNFRSFGNASEEIFYGILLSKRLNKKILFIFPRIGILRISNRELYYLEHQNVVSHKSFISITIGILFELYVLMMWIIDYIKCSIYTKIIFSFLGYKNSPFIQKNYGYIIPTIGKEKLWVPNNHNTFYEKEAIKLKWPLQYREYSPPKINTKKLNNAKIILQNIGLPKKQWFVCLHVREKKSSNEIRNVEIKNYLKAIKYIISKGGWVIRIGDPDSSALPQINNLIDYTKSKNRSELIDLVIISQSKFVLGTSSGPNMVANLFNINVLGSNLTEWSHSVSFCKLAIFKHFYSNKINKFLSIKEMLNEPFHIQRLGNYTHKDYELIDNSSEEIKYLVQSELENLNPETSTIKQINFEKTKMRILLKQLKDGEPRDWIGLAKYEKVTQQYRFIAMSLFDGVIEKRFLDKNW
jgi:putative glycosyltransferase (TIGR04372 family)